MHASNDWDATTGAGWETGGGRGGGSGSGVLFAGPQVALSSAAGGSCDVPGRPDIGGAGSCFVSLCTSWSALRFRSLGVPENAHCGELQLAVCKRKYEGAELRHGRPKPAAANANSLAYGPTFWWPRGHS